MVEKRTMGNGGMDVLVGTETMPGKIAVAAPQTLVSIIIPCCGMIEYTKLCVPSILRHTRPPYELIFLDIGSLDGTTDYLAGVKTCLPALGRGEAIRVEVVRTQSDLGIPDACKEAISTARGEYLVLLNNDTIVTQGWLLQMVTMANAHDNIGMVGPMSNYAPVGQLVETVPYRVKPKKNTGHRRFGVRETLVDVDALDAFARQFRQERKGKWNQVERLAGYCLLVKRKVLDEIGMQNLAKWTDLSLFDTDILSVKAAQAKFVLACCRDLFVHHFGTRTFSQGAAGRE